MKIIDKMRGFTLLEILATLVIIGLLVTVASMALGRKDMELNLFSAIRDMKTIEEAIINGFYPDLEIIPLDPEHPEYTTMYLCLDPEDPQQYNTMKDYLEKQDKAGLIEWSKYNCRGWHGPYLEANNSFNAASLLSPPPDEKGNPVFFPVIATPWADSCEKKAQEVEDEDSELAERYRMGRYYQILKPLILKINNKERLMMPKDIACIVCAGQDCLFNEDLLGYLDCRCNCQISCDEENIRQSCAESCWEELPGEKTRWGWFGCKKYNISKYLKGQIRSYDILCLRKFNSCIKERLPRLKAQCLAGCYLQCPHLEVTDPSSKDYVDIGDDLVMFIFNGAVRTPMEE